MANLKIDYYNVEISAISDFSPDSKDTFYFLNELCMMAGYAAQGADAAGLMAFGKRYSIIQHQLFKVCEDSGLYMEVKK